MIYHKPKFYPHAEINGLRDYANRSVSGQKDVRIDSLVSILDQERRRTRNWRILFVVGVFLAGTAGYCWSLWWNS